jgi:hypothetical protein
VEIGARVPGEIAAYPDDDVALVIVDGRYRYTHKDGTPY